MRAVVEPDVEAARVVVAGDERAGAVRPLGARSAVGERVGDQRADLRGASGIDSGGVTLAANGGELRAHLRELRRDVEGNRSEPRHARGG